MQMRMHKNLQSILTLHQRMDERQQRMEAANSLTNSLLHDILDALRNRDTNKL